MCGSPRLERSCSREAKRPQLRRPYFSGWRRSRSRRSGCITTMAVSISTTSPIIPIRVAQSILFAWLPGWCPWCVEAGGRVGLICLAEQFVFLCTGWKTGRDLRALAAYDASRSSKVCFCLKRRRWVMVASPDQLPLLPAGKIKVLIPISVCPAPDSTNLAARCHNAGSDRSLVTPA